MAESINLKKRLIGKEDINFDITGTNETENFFTADGGRKELSKINASHLPLTKDSRDKLHATNVDEALSLLSEKVDDFEATDVLSEDVTVTFQPEDDAETIQNIIDQQKKNLNGHTLTFLFPISTSQNLYAPLEWSDFFNGTVVIAGGSAESRITIYDQQDITSLFRIYRCLCEVRIEHFYFIHQKSLYAVSVESSSAVILKDCQFSGMEDADSYAVNKSTGTAFLIDCEFVEDMEFYPPEKQDGIGKALGEIFAYPGAVPPEGAFLLNGQTIYGCNELYPKFWEWVQSARVRIIDNNTYEAELAATGVCGGFVANSALGNVRLPSVVNGVLWGADSTSIGQSLAAGLPNITGSFGHIEDVSASGAFSLYDKGTIAGPNQSDDSAKVSFDASRSNPVYGNSDTVQPPAVRVSWCIQVFNATTELSEQESAQLAVLMQTKAQSDLANVNSNIDYVVESWNDGTGGWYRKYRSGWVEQGGYSLVNTGVHTVTLWVEMADANYRALISFSLTGSSSDTDGATSCPIVSDRTTTTIRINQAKKSGDNSYWEVKGYAATE